jgi:DNA repair photolyase
MSSLSASAIREILEEKSRLRELLSSQLSESEKKSAERDYHAKRPPRPCGITVHTAIGCVYQCRYCYIYDMGFKIEVKPYPLRGLQLAYALLSNKYFIPGSRGTYLAIGSISEPFHPAVVNKTLEYIEVFYRYLNNPVQFSTKAYLSSQVCERLANISSKKISPLVTIVSLSESASLEPYAPNPEKRFETIRNLREAGLKPFLFLRPVIPGLTEKEYEEIIDLAVEHGAIGVVAGTLRVTRRILSELREAGLDVSAINRRLKIPVEKMRSNVQYDVYTSDIKSQVANYARRKGLVFFPSACMANLYTHNTSCWKMVHMNVELSVKPREVDFEVVESIVKQLGGEASKVIFNRGELLVYTSSKVDSRLISEVLRSYFLACVRVTRSKENGGRLE